MIALHDEERDRARRCSLPSAEHPFELAVHRARAGRRPRCRRCPTGTSWNTPWPTSPHRAAAGSRPRPGPRTFPAPDGREGRGGPPCGRSRTRARPRRGTRRRSPCIASSSSAVASSWARRPSRTRAPRRAGRACRGRARAGRARARRGTRGTTPSPTGSPRPSAVPGMSSTPSMSSIEPFVAVGPHRREADAAVAEDRGGDAVPARRREVRVPGGLPVEVGVDVDEAGGDHQPVGVERAPRRGGDRVRPRRSRRRRPRVGGERAPARCRRRPGRRGRRGHAPRDPGFRRIPWS